MKNIDYNAIQKEIHDNYLDLKSGVLDVYTFISNISKKYFKPVDNQFGKRVNEDPYTDLLFGMLEINGIELY
jgi:hypothetical protein